MQRPFQLRFYGRSPQKATGKVQRWAHNLGTEQTAQLIALDAGPYDINIFRRLVQDAQAYLRPGGLLAFEFGVGQEVLVQRLLQKSGDYEQLQPAADHTGMPRVFVAQAVVPTAVS